MQPAVQFVALAGRLVIRQQTRAPQQVRQRDATQPPAELPKELPATSHYACGFATHFQYSPPYFLKLALQIDPCHLVWQVSEIPLLEKIAPVGKTHCQLAWPVNEILNAALVRSRSNCVHRKYIFIIEAGHASWRASALMAACIRKNLLHLPHEVAGVGTVY